MAAPSNRLFLRKLGPKVIAHPFIGRIEKFGPGKFDFRLVEDSDYTLLNMLPDSRLESDEKTESPGYACLVFEGYVVDAGHYVIFDSTGTCVVGVETPLDIGGHYFMEAVANAVAAAKREPTGGSNDVP